MKKILFAFFFIISCSVLTISLMAYTAESAQGTWLTSKGDAKINIYQCGSKTCGKIVWLPNMNDLDDKNPDKSKRINKLVGMNMLWGFNFKNNEWVDGYIYDPDSGDTYKCKMWLSNDDQIKVKGFIGISLLGRSETWTRVK
jgi:uncharacterized protein (DUF2147 family)